MYNCNISKSKLAFPLSNKIYLSVIASTALKLLRLKPEYFFLGHPVFQKYTTYLWYACLAASHCLFPGVWNKLLSSCNKSDEVNRLTTSCSASLISSACHKLLSNGDNKLVPNCYEQPVLAVLEQLIEVCYRHQPCNKVITTCSNHNNWKQEVRPHPDISLITTSVQLRYNLTFRFVFPCRQWIPLTSNKGDGVRLECKSSERSRLAVIRGMFPS